jgi:hypothetical protein
MRSSERQRARAAFLHLVFPSNKRRAKSLFTFCVWIDVVCAPWRAWLWSDTTKLVGKDESWEYASTNIDNLSSLKILFFALLTIFLFLEALKNNLQITTRRFGAEDMFIIMSISANLCECSGTLKILFFAHLMIFFLFSRRIWNSLTEPVRRIWKSLQRALSQ